MNRCSYQVVKVTEDYVYIIDLDEGKSVTNDAENVVNDLKNLLTKRRLFYRDTMGNIDEIIVEKGVFKGFRPGGVFSPQV